MHTPPPPSIYFDHAFRTNWFAGADVVRYAQYPRVSQTLVPSTGRRVYRAFLPLNVHPNAAGEYRGFVLARSTNGDTVSEEAFGGLRAKVALMWSRSQIADGDSKTLGTPGSLTDLLTSGPITFGDAADAFSELQTPPYLGYRFEADSPAFIHASAYWVQILIECQYGTEGRPNFRGVSRRMLDFRGSNDVPVAGRVFTAPLPRNMEEAEFLANPVYPTSQNFSANWAHSSQGVTFSGATSSQPILCLSVGLLR